MSLRTVGSGFWQTDRGQATILFPVSSTADALERIGESCYKSARSAFTCSTLAFSAAKSTGTSGSL